MSENDGEVHFDEVRGEGCGGGRDGGGGRGPDAEWRTAVYAKISSVQRTVVDTQNTVASHYAEQRRELKRMDQNIKRISIMPGARIRGERGGASQRAGPTTANLISCPKDLWIL